MLFRRAVEQRSSTYTLQDEEFAKFLGIELDGLSSNKMKEATYYACMKIMTDNISKLPLKLYRDTSNGTEKASDHYLYNLLKLRPNKMMSSSTFWKFIEYQRNEHGHCIVYIDTAKRGINAGKVQGLYPLDMQSVQIFVDDAGIFSKDNNVWYIYRDKSGKEYKLKDENILHFVGMTSDGITGMPVKTYLKTIVENAQSGQQYTNNYFKGGLFAKGILSFTADLNDENVKKVKERFESIANGIKNAGKLLPLPLGFSFTPINTDMASAQFLEINQLTMKQIANAFGIKSFQLNDMERSTHNNVVEMNKSFYIDTLLPILTMYEQELSYKLLTSKEIETGHFFKFNVDAILRNDIETRYKAYGIGIDKGFLTPNEARELEDKPKLEGGDQLICNGNMQKLSDVGAYYKNTSKGGELDEQNEG